MYLCEFNTLGSRLRQLLLKRFAASVIVLIMASVLVFALSRASGDPRHLFLSEYTTAEQWEQWGRDYGLDKPYPVQYLTWLKGAVQLDSANRSKNRFPPRLSSGARSGRPSSLRWVHMYLQS